MGIEHWGAELGISDISDLCLLISSVLALSPGEKSFLITTSTKHTKGEKRKRESKAKRNGEERRIIIIGVHKYGKSIPRQNTPRYSVPLIEN